MTWITIPKFNLESTRYIKQQYHIAIQVVVLPGRSYLQKSPRDEHATLELDNHRNSLVGKWISCKNNRWRCGISMEQKKIYFEEEGSPEPLEADFRNKTFNELMLWLEESLATAGFSVSSLNSTTPYKLPDYTKQKTPLCFDRNNGFEFFFPFYKNSSFLFENFKKYVDVHCENRLWPRHLNQKISIMIKDSGEPSTSTYLGLGMSPGDQYYDEPYLYVNCWPYLEGDLPEPSVGFWHIDDWVGTVFLFSDLAKFSNQRDIANQFLIDSYHTIKEGLLN